jgi:ribosomal protein L11 methyltransferase
LIEITLSGLSEEAARAVIDLFEQWGRGGAVIEEIAGDRAETRVKTYLLAEDDNSLRQIEIGLELLARAGQGAAPGGSATAGRSLPGPEIRFLAETDWAEAWKTSYQVLHVGRRLVIKPTWRGYTPQPGEVIIEIDPGLAFGSGLHPTTRLCLEALESYVRPGEAVLDVGTGSGILAIAAARLGASHVLALDTDPLAIQVAGENVHLNQVTSTVQVRPGSIPVPASQLPGAGLIVANILAETIVELSPALAANLLPGGLLIASGIIAERADRVAASLAEHGLSPVEERRDGDWVALIARRPPTSHS